MFYSQHYNLMYPCLFGCSDCFSLGFGSLFSELLSCPPSVSLHFWYHKMPRLICISPALPCNLPIRDQLLLERGLENPGHCASRPSHLAGCDCLCKHHWCFGVNLSWHTYLYQIYQFLGFLFFFRLISNLGKSYEYNTKSFLLSQILECDFLTNKDTSSITTIQPSESININTLFLSLFHSPFQTLSLYSEVKFYRSPEGRCLWRAWLSISLLLVVLSRLCIYILTTW